MATVWWTGNAYNLSQQVTIQITAVALGGTLSATINGKVVTYTCTGTDTVDTAALALFNLLSNQATAPPELNELTFSVDADTITIVATNAGVPFAGMTNGLTSAGGGGATLTQTTTVAGSSQSDPGLAANWNRAGTAAIPVNGDDVIVADSAVPILWNLTALAAVQFASYNRYQSFSGTIGLPENNPNGYVEFRPTYFKFIGPPGGTLTLWLGVGPTGSGPGRERYNLGAQRVILNVLASGSALDDYAILFLGSNANNVLTLVGTSLGIAVLPGETATINSGTVDGGALLACGPGCTWTTTLDAYGSSLTLANAPGTLTLNNGSSVTVASEGLTYGVVYLLNGSSALWLSDSNVGTLGMTRGSTFDKSQDVRSITLTNTTIDGDCTINDPFDCIVFTNPTAVQSPVQSGPFIFNSRTVKLG